MAPFSQNRSRPSAQFSTLLQKGLKSKKTLTNKLKKTSVSVGGRHDPCVGIRAVPIGEAMLACVLADHFLRNKIFQS